MKVFADTNFLISAFIARGLSSEIFELILSDHELVLSQVVLQEFEDKMRSKFKIPVSRLKELKDFLNDHVVASGGLRSTYALRDKDDEWILGDAISSQSDVLITGDKDLLVVAQDVKELKILSPRGFWELLSDQNFR